MWTCCGGGAWVVCSSSWVAQIVEPVLSIRAGHGRGASRRGVAVTRRSGRHRKLVCVRATCLPELPSGERPVCLATPACDFVRLRFVQIIGAWTVGVAGCLHEHTHMLDRSGMREQRNPQRGGQPYGT